MSGLVFSSESDLLTKPEQINPFASIRIVYGGKIIEENQPLDSHPLWSYDSGHVLVAMVFE